MTTAPPTTPQELHDMVVSHANDQDWDSMPEILVLDQDGQLSIMALAMEGNPVDYLPMVLLQILQGGTRIKALTFNVEAFRLDVSPASGVVLGDHTPSTHPSRIECRTVYTWGADFDTASYLDRHDPEGKGWFPAPTGMGLTGRIPDFGRLVQAAIAKQAVASNG